MKKQRFTTVCRTFAPCPIDPVGVADARRLTIGCRGCRALPTFGRTKVLRAGPTPLTLVGLDRLEMVAAAAVDLSAAPLCATLPSSGGEQPDHLLGDARSPGEYCPILTRCEPGASYASILGRRGIMGWR